jgi:hypothetical protein
MRYTSGKKNRINNFDLNSAGKKNPPNHEL